MTTTAATTTTTMPLAVALLLALVCMLHAPVPCRAELGIPATSPYAYVAIHYEGTPRDDEYSFGLRVLIKSLRLTETPHDIVVLVADNVRESTRAMIRKEGGIVHRVGNIPNPYRDSLERRRSFKPRFEFTFNKLYLWNMTEYERVVYLDIDNVAMHNIDAAFLCGHFCVVYMNPTLFHTGLMVVKPDTRAFNAHMRALATLDNFAHDGADQGFLTSRYPNMEQAPLFDVNQFHPNTIAAVSVLPMANVTGSNAPAMRMSTIWNFNQVYELYRCDLDLLARENHPIARDPMPVLTVGWPITPEAKPWYWWPTFFFTFHWNTWHAIRGQINDAYLHSEFVSLVFMYAVSVLVFIYWTPISRLPLIRSSLVRGVALFVTFYAVVARLDVWYYQTITIGVIAPAVLVGVLTCIGTGTFARLGASASSNSASDNSRGGGGACGCCPLAPLAGPGRNAVNSCPTQHPKFFGYGFGIGATILSIFLPLAIIPRFIYPVYGWILYFLYHFLFQIVFLHFYATTVLRLRSLPGDDDGNSDDANGPMKAGVPSDVLDAERNQLWGLSVAFKRIAMMFALDLFVFLLIQTDVHWSFVEKITVCVWTYLFAIGHEISVYRTLAESPRHIDDNETDERVLARRRRWRAASAAAHGITGGGGGAGAGAGSSGRRRSFVVPGALAASLAAGGGDASGEPAASVSVFVPPSSAASHRA